MKMYYKADGKHKIHGEMVDYIVVEDGADVPDGYFATIADAVKPKEDPKPKQTRKAKVK